MSERFDSFGETAESARDGKRLIAELKAEYERGLKATRDLLIASLLRIEYLANRSIYQCDPPVNFMGEIQDEARIALTRAGVDYSETVPKDTPKAKG